MATIEIYTHNNNTLFIDGNTLVSWCESGFDYEYAEMQRIDLDYNQRRCETALFRLCGSAYDGKTEETHKYRVKAFSPCDEDYTTIIKAHSHAEALGAVLDSLFNDDYEFFADYPMEVEEVKVMSHSEAVAMVEAAIDSAWGEYLDYHHIESGDVEPMISLELDKIADRIAELMYINAEFFGNL